MSVWTVEAEPVSAAREFWKFYRQYTHSAIHAASAAALTIFGLLVFIDPLFAVVAIAAYVCPPVVLYVLGVDMRPESGQSAATSQTERSPGPEPTTDYNGSEETTDSVGDPGDSDADTDDGDTDSDSDDGDTDSDSDGGDTDSDGDDGDTDSDGTDTDS